MPPNDLLDSAIHTLATCSHACEDRLTYLNRSKCKKVPTIEERVKERHVYNRFFERSSDGVHGILNAADDKQLEVILHEAAQAQPTAHVKGSSGGGGTRRRRRKPPQGASRERERQTDKERERGGGGWGGGDEDKSKSKFQPGNRAKKTCIPRRSRSDGVFRRADSCDPGSDRMRNRARRRWQDVGASEQVLWIFFKHICPRPRFYHGTSMQDATLAQLTFLEVELARLVASGEWEYGTCNKRVSRLFFVPKPCVNQWSCTIDMRGAKLVMRA